MKDFCKKYKIQVVLASYVLLAGVFIYGGAFKMVENIKEGADEIQKKIIDSELDKENLEKVPQLTGDYEIFSLQEKNLDVILRKESEIEFIQLLENLAKETGNEIDLKLIEEENSPTKDGQGKAKVKEKDKESIKYNLPYENYITIQLELKGEYAGLMNFLKKLESMEYYANVVSFDLKKQEKQTEEKRPSNPFIDGGGSPVAEEEAKPEENQKKEILKSLIDLIVYIQ